MPKLFDDFDLDLQKVKTNIATMSDDTGTTVAQCGGGDPATSSSLCPIPGFTTMCTKTCFFCKD